MTLLESCHIKFSLCGILGVEQMCGSTWVYVSRGATVCYSAVPGGEMARLKADLLVRYM